ncbi:MAG: gamma-glutamyl-gamma-aminobutyrate hydrolase family protein [Methylacidiphilales bacterium]|nr:gamma-glutamyl-gamma-aminobutyrate hydrolase family protein [Candidatus Methylacidiphilales bacterium]
MATSEQRPIKHLATWIEKDKETHFHEVFPVDQFHLWNARVDDVPWDDISGLVLTGGCDISAEFLRQDIPDPALIHNPEEDRDAWDFTALSKALHSCLPVLAICRGHQILNVALGGTLLLDIAGHDKFKYDNVQPLRYAAGAEVRFDQVNSSHHQAIDKLGHDLEVDAWHADDGVIEQVRLKDYPFAVGVQYHPERDALYRPLFDAFLAHVH